MLKEQILALEAREAAVLERIDDAEDTLKALKNELTITKRAKKSLEKYEEQFNEQNDPEPAPEQLVVSYQ